MSLVLVLSPTLTNQGPTKTSESGPNVTPTLAQSRPSESGPNVTPTLAQSRPSESGPNVTPTLAQSRPSESGPNVTPTLAQSRLLLLGVCHKGEAKAASPDGRLHQS